MKSKLDKFMMCILALPSLVIARSIVDVFAILGLLNFDFVFCVGSLWLTLWLLFVSDYQISSSREDCVRKQAYTKAFPCQGRWHGKAVTEE